MRSYKQAHPNLDPLLKKEGSSPGGVGILFKLSLPGDTKLEDWKLYYLEGLINNFKKIGGTVEVINNESQYEQSEDDGFEEE
jgi:hypothetical protein